jgi:hypothetical protein
MRLFDVRDIVVYGGKGAIRSSDTTTGIAPKEFMYQNWYGDSAARAELDSQALECLWRSDFVNQMSTAS